MGQMKKKLGQDNAWQKEGLPISLRGWERIKVSMLESHVQDVSLEEVWAERQWEFGMDPEMALKPRLRTLAFILSTLRSPKALSRGTSCYKVLF